MNLVLDSSDCVPFYTDMRATLAAIGVLASAYDWFVSDVETNVPVPTLGFGDVWVTGEELSEVLSRDVQFIWGVFSAVPRGTKFDMLTPPAANGNSRYWQPPEAQPQLDGACFEIVCWDSSATLLVGISASQADLFVATNPEAKSLSFSWPNADA